MPLPYATRDPRFDGYEITSGGVAEPVGVVPWADTPDLLGPPGGLAQYVPKGVKDALKTIAPSSGKAVANLALNSAIVKASAYTGAAAPFTAAALYAAKNAWLYPKKQQYFSNRGGYHGWKSLRGAWSEGKRRYTNYRYNRFSLQDRRSRARRNWRKGIRRARSRYRNKRSFKRNRAARTLQRRWRKKKRTRFRNLMYS